jgi:hypothetical protein
MANGNTTDPGAGLNAPTAGATPGRRASPQDTIALGTGFIVLFILLLYAFLTLWPSDLTDKTSGSTLETITWFGTSVGFRATVDARLLLLVMIAGGIGSFIHAATSFADFVGNERLSTNWMWWYILRPFIGMALAAIFYVTIRAGFLTSAGQPSTMNVYGVSSMAGLVGMFSKQATDKLGEVFDTLFKTGPNAGDPTRKDGLAHASATPVAASAAGTAGAEALDHGEGAIAAPTPDSALPAARGGVA